MLWKYNLKIKDLFVEKNPKSVDEVLEIVKCVESRLVAFLKINKILDDDSVALDIVLDFLSSADEGWFSNVEEAIDLFNEIIDIMYDWADNRRVLVN